ncbi:MAG: peptidoglycan glycosyltransferase, partial [Parasporobacterium sp.]|nr:peptidoglycan glycosyltransferase [Parasporobacterium sp.]
MKKRFWVITLASFIAFALVVGRLLWICIIDGDKYSKKVLAQTQTDTSAVAAKRGDITDRNGVVMATSTIVYNIILDPLVITSEEGRYLDATLELVEKHFGFSKAEVQAQIDAHPESHYVILDKEKTYKEVEGFLAEKAQMNEKYTTVAGIFMEESYKRNYAFDTLACNVIGYMEEGKGAAGLEQYYNSYLTGTDGRTYTYVNKENNIETIRRESVNGCR